MKVIPQKDYMVVERIIAPKSGSLVLPETSEPTSDELFKVLDVGPGDYDYELKSYLTPLVQKGDIVALVGYITVVSYKGEKVTLAKARDVIAKVEGC